MKKIEFIGKPQVENESENIQHRLTIDFVNSTLEIVGHNFYQADLEKIEYIIEKNKLIFEKPWNLIYKAWKQESCSIIEAFPLIVIPDKLPNKYNQRRLKSKQRAIGTLLSCLTEFDFEFEGNNNEPKIKTCLQHGTINISGILSSCTSLDTLSPLIAWIEKYFGHSNKQLTIHIDLYCGHHGRIALFAFFKYLNENYSKNVKANLYYHDIDYKEGWLDYIEDIEESEDVDLRRILFLQPSSSLINEKTDNI